MTERWPKVLSLILLLILIPMVIAYVYQGTEIKTLRAAQAETLQTLHRQTHLIADLRLELAGMHYRNFESKQELRSWTNHWVLTKMPIVVEAFGVSFELRGQKYSEYFDCDDFAEAMQRDALRDGYLMSKALVDGNGYVFGTKVSDAGNHAGNMAMTDNAYWYIEPQTGQIIHIAGRD